MAAIVYKTPKYQTTAEVRLTQTGLDADATPALGELQTTLDFIIPGRAPATSVTTMTVPTSTQIGGPGLLLSQLNRTTWFLPTTFRFRVVEKDPLPGSNLSILDRQIDFGFTSEDWADGTEHTFNSLVQGYKVILKYKVVKLQ